MSNFNWKEKASVIHQLEYNFNIERRIIYLEGEIDTYSAPFFLERVNAIRDIWTSGVPTAKEPDINLYITSPGGDINGLAALIDIIQALPNKVNTYGIGHVASAAVWLLSAATGNRLVAENTEIMVHEISTWMKGTTSDVENEAKQLIATQKNLYRLLGDFSLKDEAFWEKTLKSNKNLYLTPKACVEYGLADEIIKPQSL